jgi:hypothetical protein
MGLFSRLKANFNHGGVKVRVSAPDAIPSNQVIPVQVTVTADSAQTIMSVKAEIKAQMREQGVNLGSGGGIGVGVQRNTATSQTVAVAENREQFMLSPGESKTVELQLYINGSAANPNSLAALDTGLGALGGVVQSLVQNFDHVNYLYSVHASADVDGINLDPNDKQPIQILPPTEAVSQTIVAAADPLPIQNDQSAR